MACCSAGSSAWWMPCRRGVATTRARAAVDARRQAQVGVVEQHLGGGERRPQRQRAPRHADQRHLRRSPGHRPEHLGGVEAQRGRGVEVGVGMVRAVPAPEPRHAVQQHVPGGERGVHQRQRGDGAQAPRQPRRDAPAAAFGEVGDAAGDRRAGDGDGHRRGGAAERVARHAGGLRRGALAQRPAALGEQQRAEQAGQQQRRGARCPAGRMSLRRRAGGTPLRPPSCAAGPAGERAHEAAPGTAVAGWSPVEGGSSTAALPSRRASM